jgi:outer membrane protein TolC
MMTQRAQAILMSVTMTVALVLSAAVAVAQGKPVKPAQPGGAAPDEGRAEGEEPAAPAGAPEPTAPLGPPGPPPDEELGFDLPQVSPGRPMTLVAALDMADRRNVTLSAARIEIEKAQAQLKQSWGMVLPGAQASMQLMQRDHADTVNFSEGLPEDMLPEGMGGEMVVMPQQDLKGSIQIGMPLVNVQNWLTIGVAKQGVRVAEASIEDARQQLLLGVSQAFYMARMAGSLIELNIEQARSAAHHLKIARARFEAGTGLKIDVLRAETDLEQARQELLTAHLAYDNARDALGILTGVGGLPLPVEPRPLASPAGTDDELTSTAMGKRADVRATREMIELADRQLDAAWMQFLPTLDAAWGLDYQFTEPGELGSTDRSRWAFVFTLTVPLYNHYRYGDLDYKRAALKQAMLQAEDTEQNVSLEVRKARRDYLTALSSVEIAENQARLATEAMSLVEAAYEAGTGSSLDVTDARRTKSATDVNLVAQRLQAQLALLNLLEAIGEDMTALGK